MLCMEGIQKICSDNIKIGSLVKFKYIDKMFTGNIVHMKEAVGLVVASSEGKYVVSSAFKLFESCWIEEVISQSRPASTS